MDRNRINIVDKQRVLSRPLILDGAMGSLLAQNGMQSDKNLWSSLANITNPINVFDLHREYILAGAEIITTNTFRTNPNAVKNASINVSQKEFVKAGVNIAIEAIADKQIIIAGSNAPAEDCYQKERTISISELEYNHKKHIELLWSFGCDVIWNETQSHIDEIEIICEFCSYNKLPFILSLYFLESLNLLDGNSLESAIQNIQAYNPVAIGFNCVKPGTFENFMEVNKLPRTWGAYFNCGAGNVTDENISCGIDSKSYVHAIEPLLEVNPFFIGSCCGSMPSHTRALKEKINEVYRN